MFYKIAILLSENKRGEKQSKKIMKNKFISGLFLIIALASFNSCKEKITGCTDDTADNFNSNATEDDGSCLHSKHVGDSYGGGIVIWVDLAGEHGIIAAPSDQSDGLPWLVDTSIVTYATYTNIYKGKINTNTIVGLQGAGDYAAKICDDLVLNDFDDWYLPSKSELKEIYDNRGILEGLSEDFYWSSTENDNELWRNTAWYQSMATGGHDAANYKNFIARVRAVRSF